LYDINYTQSEIAKICNTTQATVSRLIMKKRKTGTVAHARSNGRHTVVSEEISNIINFEHTKNPFLSMRKMAQVIKKQCGKTIAANTIANFLNKKGIKAYSPAKKTGLKTNSYQKPYDCSQKLAFYE
jgi:transposase